MLNSRSRGNKLIADDFRGVNSGNYIFKMFRVCFFHSRCFCL